MRCYAGIDLGSTTTKAILIGEDGSILGRGITNSRSNYGVASSIARAEALIDARLGAVRTSLADRLHGGNVGADDLDGILASLTRCFRRVRHLQQLRILKEACLDHEEATGGDLESSLLAIFEGLEAQAEDLFAPMADRRSDFFRDLAGSGFHSFAEQESLDREVSYDALAGSFDRAIQIVENRVPESSLAADLDRAARAVHLEQQGGALTAGEMTSAVQDALDASLTEEDAVGTGYGRATLPFPKDQIRSEILCHGLGAHHMYDGTATVLDIGGQDTKAIQVDADGVVESFQMNDRCAAGCGRYLGYIADELGIGLQDLGPLAMEAERPIQITSTCTVFAGAELRDRLALGQKREDILGGLHRAIMLRAMSLLARSGGIRDEFTFTGGVAKNEAAVLALRHLVNENYGDLTINIHPDSIYTGALGAALYARNGGGNE